MTRKKETISINGHQLLLRNPVEEDAAMLLEYLRKTAEETRFLLKEPEEIRMTLEQECQFIRNVNASERSLMLLGFLDGQYVGNCSFTGMEPLRYRHRANMAIALYQKYTGMGIGTAMIQALISAAGEHGFEQLELEVVTENRRAISLYQKMGFRICGTLPDNMKYKDGTYADVYWMMRKL